MSSTISMGSAAGAWAADFRCAGRVGPNSQCAKSGKQAPMCFGQTEKSRKCGADAARKELSIARWLSP